MPNNGLHDLTEDATGFGRAEWRTCVDSLVRPRQVLEAYMTQGPDGGGHYARPLRLYLVLCGLMMLVLFLMGGTDGMLATFPPEAIDGLVAGSGKSRDAFLADFDGWMSLILVPVMCAFYAMAAAPFLRWWDPEDLGWRRAFRATFAYLNATTIPILPLSWMFYMPSLANWGMLVLALTMIVAFLRMGPGRWYRVPIAGLMKALVLLVATLVVVAVGSFLLFGMAMVGARFGP